MASYTLYHHSLGALCRRSKEDKDINMKLPKTTQGRVEAPKLRKLGTTALIICCLLISFFFFVVLRPSFDPSSILNLHTNITIQVLEENTSFVDERNFERNILSPPVEEQREDNFTSTNATLISWPLLREEKGSESMRINGSTNAEEENTKSKLEIGVELESHVDVVERNQEAHDIVGGEVLPKSNILCDFSQRRSDTCVVEGDVRVLGRASTIILAGDLQLHTSPQDTWKVRPYARKWEQPIMEKIKELTLKGPIKPKESPKCVVNHDVPAIIFSTGGFLGNFFHDFTDVLIPLFITSRQYNGDVRFLVTNFNSRWIKKYQPLLLRLSRFPIINLDGEKSTHCFPKAHVGLISHKELSINSSISPNGYSMTEFRELLRTCYSLSRNSVSKGTRRPRLLIVFRKGSRTFMNKKEVILMARGLGYKVVLAGPEETHNLPRFARIVNSCDVMMGVHGAGLANMMFLPDNATLIQIVPWGRLGYACRHDFGNPAPDMGLRYLEYEIREEESSLIYQYPRDHPVFSDPLSIHKQGWNALWSIFLNQQNIKLDVRRFRGVLQEALKSLR
ncbi:uncharacterized protein LOC109717050 isoform X2 [Ananas comosus]|uniref:Uncharacterized protein LOC109717050 isoform X2 n=1 Tax=Ananas comosus TaxID=4615 RepID=A0A6P5FRI0_ANACO|nr:uncharacterized protein LOC109717050 isoform X2 [Ananas comosus]